ncbi:hypothetical protein GLYMA_16G171950v4 [Glycine max]|nr:hypothetical protein GLYMA_16G170551v4 [Glycine max]KAG4380418.1 hypothetical protein GLYMA_16G171950v4 [Glycine max]
MVLLLSCIAFILCFRDSNVVEPNFQVKCQWVYNNVGMERKEHNKSQICHTDEL